MARAQEGALTKAPQAMARAISSFEKSVGGREALVAAMYANPDLDDDQRYLVELLSDPDRAKTPIGEVCYSAGVHIGHVLQLFKSGRFARAQVEAIDKIAERLPAVAEDFVSRAVPREVSCSVCDGTGETIVTSGDAVGEVIDCAICQATGRVTREPSLDYQKLALDLGGISPHREKGAGVNIGIFASSSPTKEARVTAEDLRNLRVSSDKLLYPGRYGGQDTSEVVDTGEVTDAEIVEVSPKSEGKAKQEAKDVPICRSSLAVATTSTEQSQGSQQSQRQSASPTSPTSPTNPLLEPPGQRP